jgi:outer membrane protein TolC
LLPVLTASALGGYQRIATPFPSNLVPKGYITANIEEILPTLAISYLLLDFGGREAAVNAAQQLSIAANVIFTAAHQKLIFDVARAYFLLDGADAAVRATEQALKDAEEVQSSAEASYSHGLGTIVEVQLARRATAAALRTGANPDRTARCDIRAADGDGSAAHHATANRRGVESAAATPDWRHVAAFTRRSAAPASGPDRGGGEAAGER